MIQWLYEKVTGRCWHIYSLEVGTVCNYKCKKCGKRIIK